MTSEQAIEGIREPALGHSAGKGSTFGPEVKIYRQLENAPFQHTTALPDKIGIDMTTPHLWNSRLVSFIA